MTGLRGVRLRFRSPPTRGIPTTRLPTRPVACPLARSKRQPLAAAPRDLSGDVPQAFEQFPFPFRDFGPLLFSRAGAGVEIPLFGTVFASESFRATTASVADNEGPRCVWRGRLAGEDGGACFVAVSPEGALGYAQRGRTMYTLFPVNEGLLEVAKIDQALVHHRAAPLPTAPRAAMGARPAFTADYPIQILVLYPRSGMLGWLSGTPRVRTLVEFGMEKHLEGVFESYQTGITFTVTFQATTHQPTGATLAAMEQDLCWLRTDPSAVSARNASNADIVCLFVDDGEVGGMTYPNEPLDESFAYTVVVWWAWSSTFNLAHEIGHVFGLYHHPGEATALTRGCPFGYVIQDVATGQPVARTIMCDQRASLPYLPREPKFSRPAVICGKRYGRPCGYSGTPLDHAADSLGHLLRVAPTVSHFR